MRSFIRAGLSALLLFSSLQGFAQDTDPVPVGAGPFRLSIYGGGAFRPGRVQETGNDIIDAHNKRLKTGFNYGASATWFFSDDLGLGVKYADMHSKAEDSVTLTLDNGTVRSGIYRDMVDIRFFGAMLANRSVSKNGRWILFADYGLGYVRYSDIGRIIDPVSEVGGTFGASVDIGVDLRLSKRVFLGASVNAVGGLLSAYDITAGGKTQHISLEKDEREGLYGISASIGLTFYL